MITPELLQQYFVKQPPTYRFHAEAVAVAEKLRAHSREEFPERLLNTARPNEEPKYKEYRRAVYEPKTKPIFDRVITNLCKIERAEDWSIRYQEGDNGLREYCEENFPYFDTLTNWFFTLGLRRMIDDPHAVALVIPRNLDAPDNEQRNPYVQLFDCEFVYDFLEGERCILLDKEKSEVTDGAGKPKTEGNIFHCADRTHYYKAVQYGKKQDYTFLVYPYPHNMGYMPALMLGGKVKEFQAGYLLYDSFLSPCVPDWNEAIRRYSDHQVNMVLHLHPREWAMRDTPCKPCNGKGKVTEKRTVAMGTTTVNSDCSVCHGTGYVTTETPFGKIIVNPVAQKALNESLPTITPPGGFITRDIGSISFLKEEVESCLKAGLMAVNLEFLMQEPELNSGIAKSYDRQELNTFFYSISRHVVENLIKPIYYFVNEWRYGYLTPQAREKLLPQINIPAKFDLITSALASARLDTAIKGNFDKSLITRLQSEYARKEFGEDAIEARLIEVSSQLDPLPNLTVEEKMSTLSAGMCSQEEATLSVKLPSFISRAMAENKDFLEIGYAKQMLIVLGFAQEAVQESKKNVVPMFNPTNEQGAA